MDHFVNNTFVQFHPCLLMRHCRGTHENESRQPTRQGAHSPCKFRYRNPNSTLTLYGRLRFLALPQPAAPPLSCPGLRVDRCRWRIERGEPVAAASRLCSREAGLPSAVPDSPPAALSVPHGPRLAAPLIFSFPRDSAAIALATAPAAAGLFHRRAQQEKAAGLSCGKRVCVGQQRLSCLSGAAMCSRLAARIALNCVLRATGNMRISQPCCSTLLTSPPCTTGTALCCWHCLLLPAWQRARCSRNAAPFRAPCAQRLPLHSAHT